MTNTTSAPELWPASNERPVDIRGEKRWVRPRRLPATPADQPWTTQLAADTTLRDGTWRTGDREDLWALAACGLAFAAAAASLALLV